MGARQGRRLIPAVANVGRGDPQLCESCAKCGKLPVLQAFAGNHYSHRRSAATDLPVGFERIWANLAASLEPVAFASIAGVVGI